MFKTNVMMIKGLMMIKFYGYKKCSTCRKAEKFLLEKKVKFQSIDITQSPPSKEELKAIFVISEKPIKKMFNTSGIVYREMKLKEKIDSMSESEAFKLLASDGKIIKRPLVFDGKRATIGFDAEEYEKNWS